MSGPDSGVKDVGLEEGGVPRRIALLGNPNTGKTTLFNRLSGLRHKTSNFPGTTLEARVAFVRAGVEGGRDADLIDLPGIYALELDQVEARVCREVLAGTAAPRGEPMGAPECAVVVVDAANLARNLTLVGEVVRRRLPTVIAVNMIDLAEGKGIKLDPARLSEALGCEVVPTNARAGDGVDELRLSIRRARIPAPVEAVPADVQGLRHWAQEMADRALHPEHVGEVPDILEETKSDRADKLIMHPVLGPVIFAGVMTGLFYVLFVLAQYPMGWIEAIFSGNGDWVAGWQPQWLQHVIGSGAVGVVKDVMPDGILRDLLTDGVIAGVGSTVVFLPQICLLFFLIALLEDTGYLARGAFVMDRLLRPFGLPGHAFVPLLSSHACALPGIMATRAIPDPKERLATILVAPFMTCSARLPVYILLTTLLFKDRPMMAALAFVGCYALGILAGVFSALIARRTFLRGKSRAMVMELPSYKWPSVRSAVLGTIDRGWVFLKNAGTVILMICIVLWWMGAYPKVASPAFVTEIRDRITANDEPFVRTSPEVQSEAIGHGLSRFVGVKGQSAIDRTVREDVIAVLDEIESRHAKTHSFLGIIGRGLQPVFQPLGFDWQLTIGVMASFAAREVFVSTMNVVIAGQEEGGDEQGEQRLMQQIQDAKRSDGATPVFTPAVSWALLVFFVLAMQCLPTLAVTAKEAGGVKWALLQLAWMSGMAYVAALIVYQVMR